MTDAMTALRLDGELTIYRAAELRLVLQQALAGLSAGAGLEVNLADVTEMDSAGVQLLLSASKTGRARGCELRLVDHSPAVLEVFGTLQLAPLFDAALPVAAR